MWVYIHLSTVALLWFCCLRKRCHKIKHGCFVCLSSTGSCCHQCAACCRRRKRRMSLEEVDIPLVTVVPASGSGRRRIPPSKTIVVATVMLILLSPSQASQRVSMQTADYKECSENDQGLCSDIHSTTVTMSELRRDLHIRTAWTPAEIYHQIHLFMEQIIYKCTPVVHYYTRDVQIATHSIKRCAFAGSCSPSYCYSVSARTMIPELQEFNELPGISRCAESCGTIACGCALPIPGCLYSRTVADPVNSLVYTVVSCPSWSTTVYLTAEETKPTGEVTKSGLRVILGATVSFGSTNITLDFVSTLPTSLFSSLFLVENDGTLTQNGVLVLSDTDIALYCPTLYCQHDELFPQKHLFLLSQHGQSRLYCPTFNISAALASFQYRLLLLTPSLSPLPRTYSWSNIIPSVRSCQSPA